MMVWLVAWLFASTAAPADGVVGPSGTLGKEVYRARRQAVLAALKTDAALVMQNMKFAGDRSGMDFYYLTGIEEPGAALLLIPGELPDKEILFLDDLNVEADRWTGTRATLPSLAMQNATGFDKIARMNQLASWLINACRHSTGLAFIGYFNDQAQPLEFKPYAKAHEDTLSSCAIKSREGLLGAMRESKSGEEIRLLRQAVSFTAAGHAAALATIHAGETEFQLRDAIDAAFRKAGARHVAYDSIVGAGPDGAILHSARDNRVLQDGNLVVIDAGAESEMYASDVTRTLPVSGHFTVEQREVYNVVLRAQAAGIAAAKPGATFEQIASAAKKIIEAAGYGDFYFHSVGHFVGLEVHDAGSYDKPLPVGAVITVEPGIYLATRGFGVRIEDTVLITKDGNEVLSKGIPKEIADIERTMAARATAH